jgi:hypothetical protein
MAVKEVIRHFYGPGPEVNDGDGSTWVETAAVVERNAHSAVFSIETSKSTYVLGTSLDEATQRRTESEAPTQSNNEALNFFNVLNDATERSAPHDQNASLTTTVIPNECEPTPINVVLREGVDFSTTELNKKMSNGVFLSRVTDLQFASTSASEQMRTEMNIPVQNAIMKEVATQQFNDVELKVLATDGGRPSRSMQRFVPDLFATGTYSYYINQSFLFVSSPWAFRLDRRVYTYVHIYIHCVPSA